MLFQRCAPEDSVRFVGFLKLAIYRIGCFVFHVLDSTSLAPEREIQLRGAYPIRGLWFGATFKCAIPNRRYLVEQFPPRSRLLAGLQSERGVDGSLAILCGLLGHLFLDSLALLADSPHLFLPKLKARPVVRQLPALLLHYAHLPLSLLIPMRRVRPML